MNFSNQTTNEPFKDAHGLYTHATMIGVFMDAILEKAEAW